MNVTVTIDLTIDSITLSAGGTVYEITIPNNLFQHFYFPDGTYDYGGTVPTEWVFTTL